MSMFRLLWLALVVCVGMSVSAQTELDKDLSPQLGVVTPASGPGVVDLVVMQDGSGLPAGQGNVADGGTLYTQHCLVCHGDKGENGISDRLVGGHGTLTTGVPVKTLGSYWPYATTVYDYIRRAMPYQTPGSLSANEVYSLTAYLLYLNGIVQPDTVLDAGSLVEIKMPNREGFVWNVAP